MISLRDILKIMIKYDKKLIVYYIMNKVVENGSLDNVI